MRAAKEIQEMSARALPLYELLVDLASGVRFFPWVALLPPAEWKAEPKIRTFR